MPNGFLRRLLKLARGAAPAGAAQDQQLTSLTDAEIQAAQLKYEAIRTAGERVRRQRGHPNRFLSQQHRDAVVRFFSG